MASKRKPEEETEEQGVPVPQEGNDDGDDDFGPMPVPEGVEEESKFQNKKKKRVFEHEALYLENMPSQDLYEVSYNHRDNVTHVIVTKTDFIISASCDGHVKFWKKKTDAGIDFVKHLRCHLGSIDGLSASADGLLLATTSSDQSIKIYDIVNFDMIDMCKVDFAPSICEWVHAPGSPLALLACCEKGSGKIRVYNVRENFALVGTVELHKITVLAMKYNHHYDCVISCDEKGIINYWSGQPPKFGFPANLKFDRLDSDLFDYSKNKAVPWSINTSPDGKMFIMTGSDRKVRIFNFLDGKLLRVYDESIDFFLNQQQKESILPSMEFGRRVAAERDLEKHGSLRHENAIFDESGNFVLYPTLLGVKVVNIVTNKLVRVIGKEENLRVMHIGLFQGKPKKLGAAAMTLQLVVAENPALNLTDRDPTLFCTAYKKNRFYLFTKREAQEIGGEVGRDVFNEKPSKEEQIAATSALSNQRLAETAIIHTTMGDIHLHLFPKEAPKAVENFTVHSRNGYYNGHMFHRVIKSFMIQTGDPLGDGTGGESIWNEDFEDEFHPTLRHDRPYMLSMANRGPRTNGSQFFVTVAPSPWLDNKHTIFGRVVKGTEVAFGISNVRTNPKDDRPLEDVKVINIVVR